MQYSRELGRALVLCAATTLPAVSLAANEPEPTQPGPPVQIICPDGEFATTVPQDGSVCVRMDDGGVLIVSVIRLEGAVVPPIYAGEFLDRGRMSASIDDFGGPFGWTGRPLVDPRASTPEAVDIPSSAEENCK